MDRLIAASARHEPQSLEQALHVAESQAGKIDWSVLDEWVVREGTSGAKEAIEFYKRIGRRHP